MNANEVLGIDLGNTIIYKREPLPDAFRVIRELINKRFGERVYIVSRVNPEQEIRARAFVTSLEFTTHINIPIERVHFCRERHEKGPICKKMGITHFVDDRPEVMAHMPDTVIKKILFNPDPHEWCNYKQKLEGTFIVKSWVDVEKLLLHTLQ